MSKPLTIGELKSLKKGDWVWVVTLQDEYRPNDVPYGEYHKIVGTLSHYYFEVNYGTTDYYELPYKDYGKTWLAYKNKEQAETNGEIVELPCKVGDTVYLIYSSEQREPIPFVVDFIVTHKLREEERIFVYDNDGHGGRFGDCSKGNYVWYIGTNKAQAEARLKELKGEE